MIEGVLLDDVVANLTPANEGSARILHRVDVFRIDLDHLGGTPQDFIHIGAGFERTNILVFAFEKQRPVQPVNAGDQQRGDDAESQSG